MTKALFGVIADDITGACDVASGVTELGLRTVIVMGLPIEPLEAEIDCVVIALKSRTTDVETATDLSVQAARWLIDNGAELLYQKYCSTFDSTDRGNIGPVAEALVDLLDSQRQVRTLTIGTPSTPQVGRTQYRGHLFVGGSLLSESSLRDHPLTPMRDSNLVRVLQRQTRRPVALIGYETVLAGAAAIRAELNSHAAENTTHLLVDAVTDDDLDAVATAISAQSLQLAILPGGGAGLATALARRFAGKLCQSVGESLKGPDADDAAVAVPGGRRLILSGSSSEKTLEQVRAFNGTIIEVDPFALSADSETAIDALMADVTHSFERDQDQPVLLSATMPPERVRAVQERLGQSAAADLIEAALAHIAVHAVKALGVTHIIVAGGETSGAIASSLGAHVLRVGKLVAPGVPWTVFNSFAGPIALLLKSGNFGDKDLFTTAWDKRP